MNQTDNLFLSYVLTGEYFSVHFLPYIHVVSCTRHEEGI